jgi:HEAT repeat protein
MFPFCVFLCVLCDSVVSLFTLSSARAVELDHARESDPPIKSEKALTPTPRFAPRLKSLWLEAMARPEADLKRQAADAIVRAHRLGMPGLDETVTQLLKELEAADARPVVRLAAARALVALDARQAAEVLMRHAQADGSDAARLLEPALARWDYAPMRPIWLARLESPRTPREPLLLAIQAAAIVKLSDAIPHLRRLALDSKTERGVRLEAARTLAALQSADLEPDARRLADGAGSRGMIDRLVAATLLRHHRGSACEAILLQLAADSEPAVAVIAGGRLAEINSDRLEPLLDRLAAHSDSGLRQLAARVLAERRTPAAVARLGPLLDDPHRDLRISVRESLVALADVPALAEPVRQEAVRMLNTESPRGREQAAIVVGAVRHEPAAKRLLQLLDDRAAEVRVAAAWALRRLAVPTTAAAILERVQVLTDKTPEGPVEDEPRVGMFEDLGHLIEALGALRYRPAAPILKKYLPPPPRPLPMKITPVYFNDMRAAAFWSLGRIYAEDPQPDLVADFRASLEDDVEPVRVMAAVGIGRMKAKDLAPALRQSYLDDSVPLVVRRACAWSLEQLTGEPVAPPQVHPTTRETWYGGWFLEPLNNPSQK